VSFEEHEQIGIALVDLNRDAAPIATPSAAGAVPTVATVAAWSAIATPRPLRGIGPILALATRFPVATPATMPPLATTCQQTHDALTSDHEPFTDGLLPFRWDRSGSLQHD
jgi:hypothetical protein